MKVSLPARRPETQFDQPQKRFASRRSAIGRRKERWFYLMISPWLLGFAALQAAPVAAAFVMALFDWPLPQPPRFVGWDHFAALHQDGLFVKTLLNSLYFTLGTVPTAIGLGLLLALLLNHKLPGVRLVRAVFLMPAAISGVATTLAWGWVFNARYGLLNALLRSVGLPGPSWLLSEILAMPTMMLIHLWTAGVNMIVFLAAIRAVPAELTEAALIDGADGWQRFRHITWPLISPATFYLLLINLIGTFQVFTPMYLLTGGGPNNATLTLPLYIYQTAFAWGSLGYASALSAVLFALVLGLTALLVRSLEPRVYYLGRRA